MAGELEDSVGKLEEVRQVDGWTPILLVSEDLTPLPLVEQALPIIGMFSGLMGRGRLARYRVAILRELAVLPRSRVPIRTIQDAIPWMEPSSVSRLVQDIRGAGLLDYDARLDTYQLNREARVVAAICEALTAATVDYARIIKILAATMRLADAMNAPAEVAYATFLSTIAVLEFDHAELNRLMDDYSDDSLLEAARMAESHLEDMRSLLEEQADMFARFHGDPQFLEHDQRAHHMIASLGRLSAEVVSQLSQRASLRLRGNLRVSRDDLRKIIAQSEIAALADLVRDSALQPVFLPQNDVVAAFTALDEYLGRERRLPPSPPQPATLEVQPITEPETDPVDIAVAALRELADDGEAQLHEWVACGTWDDAVERMVNAAEAWSRYGPAGDNTIGIDLDALREVCRIGGRGVGWMSLTRVRKREDGPPHDAS
jgi:hypothetical protein